MSATRNSETPSTPRKNLMSSDGTQVWETTNWKCVVVGLELHQQDDAEHAGEDAHQDGDLPSDLRPRPWDQADQQRPEQRDEDEGGQDREPERAAFGGEDGRGHEKDTWVRTKAMMRTAPSPTMSAYQRT